MAENNVNAPADGGLETVTRIEWLTELTTVFEMSVEEQNYPDNYYSDINSSDAYYYQVMLATEFGLVDVEAGEALKPDDEATREFVAHSFNLCMGYTDGVTEYTFAEAGSVTYPDDIQIAVNNGWFALSDGAFMPEKAVTRQEADNLIKIAGEAVESIKVDDDYEGHYEFADGVIVIPQTVGIELKNIDEYVFTNCDMELKAGDLIGMETAVPVVNKVVSAVRVDGVLTVTTTDVSLEEGFKDIDIQGNVGVSLLDIQAYDSSVEIKYVVGGTEEENYEDGEFYSSLQELFAQGLGEEDVEAVVATKDFYAADSGYTDINFGGRGKVGVKFTYKNVNIEHKISLFHSYVKVGRNSKRKRFIQFVRGGYVQCGKAPGKGAGRRNRVCRAFAGRRTEGFHRT